jgi:hypothetical protein
MVHTPACVALRVHFNMCSVTSEPAISADRSCPLAFAAVGMHLMASRVWTTDETHTRCVPEPQEHTYFVPSTMQQTGGRRALLCHQLEFTGCAQQYGHATSMLMLIGHKLLATAIAEVAVGARYGYALTCSTWSFRSSCGENMRAPSEHWIANVCNGCGLTTKERQITQQHKHHFKIQRRLGHHRKGYARGGKQQEETALVWR